MAARSPLGPGPRYIRYHPLYYSLGLHSSFIIHGFIAHYIVSTIQVSITKLWSSAFNYNYDSEDLLDIRTVYPSEPCFIDKI